jgi:D-alanyl-lipoteichoic acid acyltransferase DltB (MBOAT superfamily)
VLAFAICITIINYYLGIIVERTRKSRIKFFWVGIIINIGVLAFFKYINFLFENINFLLTIFPNKQQIPYLSIIIPIGISYYTFQALGYIIRINRGGEKAEKNFIKFALFLTFFPKFLSGPIERSNHFFPQLTQRIDFNGKLVTEGLQLFLWGLFKKVVIANNLAGPVMLLYNNVENYTGVPLLVVMFLQTVHIYCDFSGYTDMALGSAKIFGINLADNFRRPFFAKSIGELWRRWHISLSSWCNDFIFTPFIIKYRKLGNNAAIWGIFITFFIIGIWHGANWTFVVLGLLQGIAISYEFYTKKSRIKIANKISSKLVIASSRIITFVFFSFSLIFFNAHSIMDAWYFVTHLFNDLEFKLIGYDLIYEKVPFIIAFTAFIVLIILEYLQENGREILNKYLNKPIWIKWLGYYFLIVLIYYFSGNQDTFVYLQF